MNEKEQKNRAKDSIKFLLVKDKPNVQRRLLSTIIAAAATTATTAATTATTTVAVAVAVSATAVRGKLTIIFNCLQFAAPLSLAR